MHCRCSAACPQRHSGVLHAVEGLALRQARERQEYAQVLRVAHVCRPSFLRRLMASSRQTNCESKRVSNVGFSLTSNLRTRFTVAPKACRCLSDATGYYRTRKLAAPAHAWMRQGGAEAAVWPDVPRQRHTGLVSLRRQPSDVVATGRQGLSEHCAARCRSQVRQARRQGSRARPAAVRRPCTARVLGDPLKVRAVHSYMPVCTVWRECCESHRCKSANLSMACVGDPGGHAILIRPLH